MKYLVLHVHVYYIIAYLLTTRNKILTFKYFTHYNFLHYFAVTMVHASTAVLFCFLWRNFQKGIKTGTQKYGHSLLLEQTKKNIATTDHK